MNAERLCRALLRNGLPDHLLQKRPGTSLGRAPGSSGAPWPELRDQLPREPEGDPFALSTCSSPIGNLAVTSDEEDL